MKCERANQLQSTGLGVLIEVFPEAEMVGGVEDKTERVAWRGVDPDEPDDVCMGELGKYPNLFEVSLGRGMNNVVCQGSSFLTGKVCSKVQDSWHL